MNARKRPRAAPARTSAPRPPPRPPRRPARPGARRSASSARVGQLDLDRPRRDRAALVDAQLLEVGDDHARVLARPRRTRIMSPGGDRRATPSRWMTLTRRGARRASRSPAGRGRAARRCGGGPCRRPYPFRPTACKFRCRTFSVRPPPSPLRTHVPPLHTSRGPADGRRGGWPRCRVPSSQVCGRRSARAAARRAPVRRRPGRRFRNARGRRHRPPSPHAPVDGPICPTRTGPRCGLPPGRGGPVRRCAAAVLPGPGDGRQPSARPAHRSAAPGSRRFRAALARAVTVRARAWAGTAAGEGGAVRDPARSSVGARARAGGAGRRASDRRQ